MDNKKKISQYKSLAAQGYFYDDLFDYKQLYNSQDYDSSAIKEHWQNFISGQDYQTKKYPISFYLNIPFCLSKCKYCRYYSEVNCNKKNLDSYVDYLIDSFSFYKDSFKSVNFNSLIVGGGTPSVLSNLQLIKLNKNLYKYFKFNDDSTRCFEFNPRDLLDFDKIFLINKLGYNRISFGIQTFNQKILRQENRDGINYNDLKKTLSYMKKLKFRWINADLMIGLDNQKSSDILADFLKLSDLKVDSVTVYVYKRQPDKIKIAASEVNVFLTKYYDNEIPKFQKSLSDLASKSGYKILDMRANTGQIFIRQDLYKKKENYKVGDSMPIYIFGLGPGSGSQITGDLMYYQKTDNDYIFKPDKKIYNGIKWSLKDTLREYVLSVIHSNDFIDLKKLKNDLHIDLSAYFQEEINLMIKYKKATLKNNKLQFHFKDKFDKAVYDKFFYDQNLLDKKLKELKII